jgi:hypothetical protein
MLAMEYSINVTAYMKAIISENTENSILNPPIINIRMTLAIDVIIEKIKEAFIFEPASCWYFWLNKNCEENSMVAIIKSE